jgi:PTH1 family peptidyl-tRNA hydrolase
LKLVIGLGNPGLRYKNTRHNIGFSVVKEISKEFGIPLRKRTYNGLLGRGAVNGKKVILFAPETYMNLSGEAVRKAMQKEKIPPEDSLVACDDINLKFGFIRLRKKGSSGGHNGMNSIIEYLGTDDFPRLRIGVGKSHKVSDVARFVLKPFDSAERPLLKDIIGRASRCAACWVKDGPDKAMSRFNKRQSA